MSLHDRQETTYGKHHGPSEAAEEILEIWATLVEIQ